jgi:sugar lactone lactonase YvrE
MVQNKEPLLAKKWHDPFTRLLFFVVVLLTMSGCGPLAQKRQPRFFWPPPPAEAKIEYLNFYAVDEDLQRGVDHRLEQAILGRSPVKRLIEKPFSVASDGRGRFFVADFSGGVTHVFDLLHHKYRQLGDVLWAQKVLVDSVGEIWALNSGKGIIFHFAADEAMIAELKLPGTERAGSFAVDRARERIYVVDTPHHQLRLYDLTGRFLETMGRRGKAPGEFNYPGDIDLDAAGNLYVVDVMNARIQILAPDGQVLRTFGERGTESGSFSMPKGIAVSPSGLVYVSDANLHKIVIFNTNGDYLLTIGGRYVYTGKGVAPGGFYFPAGLDVDANETLWVADMMNGMVHEFQYLTPAYLAKRPILDQDIYRPQESDFENSEDGALSPPPAVQ